MSPVKQAGPVASPTTSPAAISAARRVTVRGFYPPARFRQAGGLGPGPWQVARPPPQGRGRCRAGLVTNGGSRGFTEVLFAYASCMANNGQTMAGLNANSPFYNLTTAVAMAAGRFGLAALALVLAGRFAAQVRKPESIGSMPCDTPTFGAVVLGSVVLVGALCFLPALALGPIADHLRP